jgi:alpha-amylase
VDKHQTSICFYFQVHQPWRLRKYSVFDIGKNQDYFDDAKNGEVLRKVARKCYLPTNQVIKELLGTYPEFKVAYSLSGVVLEQFARFAPEVLASFQDLVRVGKGRVEILGETYYHSLAFLYSCDEFREQVQQHSEAVREYFGQTPRVFRNTELIYNNELAHEIQELGFAGVVAEGADHVLGWRSPNYVYTPATAPKLRLLLKNYKLSDDVAFRFSNKSWSEYPLTIDKYVSWLEKTQGDFIGLFMDYETFGEHQWEDTGIFEFLRHLPREVDKYPTLTFATPSEVIKQYEPRGELDIHNLVSWADMERDVSAWLGNTMQQEAMREAYDLRDRVKQFLHGESDQARGSRTNALEPTKRRPVVDSLSQKQSLATAPSNSSTPSTPHKSIIPINHTKQPEVRSDDHSPASEKLQVVDDWRKLLTSDHYYYMCTKWFSDGDVHKYFNPYDSPYDAFITFMNVINDLEKRLE